MMMIVVAQHGPKSINARPKAFNNTPKDDVLAVEMGRGHRANEELASIPD